MEQMPGFEVPDEAIPEPPVRIEDETRDRLTRVLAAIVSGHTPEEITGFLADKFPAAIERFMRAPLEAEEMSAHVDLILAVLQTVPEGATAAA